MFSEYSRNWPMCDQGSLGAQHRQFPSFQPSPVRDAKQLGEKLVISSGTLVR